jgi:zinc D-Ala-D-Ala carboxypeptidase
MRMPEPQRSSTSGYPKRADGQNGHTHVQSKRVPANDSGGAAAPLIVHEVLCSPGQPLDAATRSFMEPRFGEDFSQVRVHSDNRSASASEAIGAKAFVHGQNLVLGSRHYRPNTSDGLRLIAHELTHVIQQSDGPPGSAIQRQIDTGYIDHGANAHAMGKFDRITGIYTVPEDKSIYTDQSKPYDTMYSIAKRFGTTPDDILQLNGPESSQLNPGQEIKLPKLSSKMETRADPIHKESGLKLPPVKRAREASLDFILIAQNVWNAMFGGVTGAGTNEKVVYANLTKLKHDKTLIDGFKKIYRALHGSDVVADIKSEFSNTWWVGSELTKALGYLNASVAESLPAAATTGGATGDAKHPHFSLKQLTHSSTATKMGIENKPTPIHQKHLENVAEQMEAVRALFNRPITITNAYRSPIVNKAVGGTPTSAHPLGYAADFHVSGLDDLAAAKVIRDSGLKFDQLIYEKNRCVHISFDPRLRQQVKRQPGPAGSPLYDGLEP